jgi:hypothetical protein
MSKKFNELQFLRKLSTVHQNLKYKVEKLKLPFWQFSFAISSFTKIANIPL